MRRRPLLLKPSLLCWLLFSGLVLLPAVSQQQFEQYEAASFDDDNTEGWRQHQQQSQLQQIQRRSVVDIHRAQPRSTQANGGFAPQQIIRSRAQGYTTDVRQARQAVVVDCSAPFNGQCDAAGTNFNPALAGGIRGAPGIKARLNPKAFQYLSTIAVGLLNYAIKRARLPNISQCIPQVNGCINVYNLYVSRYRCPQRVTIYPAPPNQIVVDVQNLDIGVTGNLGGQIVILIPIALFGIVQVNAHQVSVRVAVTIVNGPDGGPILQMVSCSASIGYVDVYIQNGGLIGDIANSQFRGKISEMVRQQIPGQLCQRLPGILDQEINSKIAQKIPRLIPVSQLLQMAINSFGLGNLLGGVTGQCPSSCGNRKAAALAAAQKANSSVLALPQDKDQGEGNGSISKLTPVSTSGHGDKNGGKPLQRPSPTPAAVIHRDEPQKRPSGQQQQGHGKTAEKAGGGGGQVTNGGLNSGSSNSNRAHAGPMVVVNSGTTSARPNQSHLHRRQLIAPFAPHALRPARAAKTHQQQQLLLSKSFPIVLARPRADRATPSESGRLSFVDPGENYCANCPQTGEDNPLGFLAVILQSMDLSKLNNIYLNVQVMNTYATNQDFTIELNGEFSVCGRGCTPFGAFPMQFPNCANCKMVDVLISDFTINSLLYHLHNVGFLRVRVGPETPKIGDLLKTTCGGGEGEEEGTGDQLEDHGVETEEGTVIQVQAEPAAAAAAKSKTKSKRGRRRKRQDAGDLASLGICLGDILPAVRERYPDQRVYIIISSERAPSVVLSGRNGGTATIDFVLNADFYIQSTNEKVGTIRIAAIVDVTVRPQPGRITAHADITYLDLKDVGNQLGLPQDALDNLGNLGKEIILKAGNDALERGSSLSLPPGLGGLPISILNPEIHFQEHALLLSADFTIDPSGLGGSEPC